jgi:hypothetical protein
MLEVVSSDGRTVDLQIDESCEQRPLPGPISDLVSPQSVKGTAVGREITTLVNFVGNLNQKQSHLREEPPSTWNHHLGNLMLKFE